ncbi:hypothetical protein D3C75_1311260 [compost metagenome]
MTASSSSSSQRMNSSDCRYGYSARVYCRIKSRLMRELLWKKLASSAGRAKMCRTLLR